MPHDAGLAEGQTTDGSTITLHTLLTLNDPFGTNDGEECWSFDVTVFGRTANTSIVFQRRVRGIAFVDLGTPTLVIVEQDTHPSLTRIKGGTNTLAEVVLNGDDVDVEVTGEGAGVDIDWTVLGHSVTKVGPPF